MVGGRVATTMGTPRVRHSVGGGGWANEAPHCQGELEEFRQVLGEVSFVGWAESWPYAMCVLLVCGGLPRPQPTLLPALLMDLRKGCGSERGQ